MIIAAIEWHITHKDSVEDKEQKEQDSTEEQLRKDRDYFHQKWLEDEEEIDSLRDQIRNLKDLNSNKENHNESN